MKTSTYQRCHNAVKLLPAHAHSRRFETVEPFTAHATLMRIVDFIIGAILGATMAHFVVDAGAWRLSQSLQRLYIGKRFAFVFGNHAD